MRTLISRRSKLDSSTHKSQRPGKFTKYVIDSTSEPLHVLSGLMRTLRESNVSGPRLLRLKLESTHLIGKGAQFEVFGLDEHLSASLKQEKGKASEILAQSLGLACGQTLASCEYQEDCFVQRCKCAFELPIKSSTSRDRPRCAIHLFVIIQT